MFDSLWDTLKSPAKISQTNRSRSHPFASSLASSPLQVYWWSMSDPLSTTTRGLQPEWKASVDIKRLCSKFWGKNSRRLMPKARNEFWDLKDLSQIADLSGWWFKHSTVSTGNPQQVFEGRVWICNESLWIHENKSSEMLQTLATRKPVSEADLISGICGWRQATMRGNEVSVGQWCTPNLG